MAWTMTLRMTLGSAASPRAASSTQRMPRGARARAATSRRIDDELERKMREHVAHGAGHAAPCRLQRRGASERPHVVEVVRPFGRRHLDHAAEQSLSPAACAAAWRRPRAPRRTPRRAAARPSFFGALRGKRLRHRRARAPRTTSFHGHSAQAGFFGVQIVAPRSIIACAKSPARRSGVSASASARIVGLAAGQRLPRRRRAARSRARHCRRPAIARCDRTRSPRSPPPCRRRCRAVRAAPPRCREIFRRAARDRAARRRADCARARNSRARPRA